MALNKAALETDILTLMDELFNNPAGLSDLGARQKYAADLATAIDAFVKTGTPRVQGTGLTAGSNAVTGTTVTGNIT